MKNLTFKIITVFSLFFGIIANSFSQVEPQFTNYMQNVQQFNPAYVGAIQEASITGMYRSQWEGFEGAPVAQFLSYITPLNNNKMGVGLNLLQDKIGPSSYKSFSVVYAYNLNFSHKSSLSLGLNAGGAFFDIDFTKGNFENSGDRAQENVNNQFYGKVGAGLIFNSGNWFAGVSIPNFFKEDFYDTEVRQIVADKVQWNLVTGYNIPVNDGILFRPSVLANVVKGNPVTINANLNLLVNDRWNFGAGYRHTETLSAQVGFHVLQNMFLGYSYDYGIGDFSNYHDGSHELVLKFRFNQRSYSPPATALASYY